MCTKIALVSPASDEEWTSYHRIRRTILFEKRGQFIDEPWQRRGFGRVLIRLAESFAIEHGARRMESSVAADAIGFYDKCGYRLLSSDAGAATHMGKNLP